MRLPLLALTIIFAGNTAFAQDGAVSLTLKEALRQAVEKNLDVRAELYNPAQAEADLRKNRAIYETHLTLDTSYQDSTTVATSRVSGNKVKTFKIAPGAYRLLPTGGTVSLAYDNLYTDTNSSFATFNSYWQSDVTLSLSQPLLKNFGRDTTELNIRVAELSKDGSLKRFKGKLLTTVAQVESEYYKLGSLRDDLASKRVSLALAKRVLTETDARVKAGVLPAMEILNAQFGVASREKDVIDAEKAVRDQVDVLRVLLHMEGVGDIVTTDAPTRVEFFMSEDDAIRRALSQRPELEDLQSQLATSEVQTRVAKARILPDLNLNASVAMTGLAERYTRTVEQVGSTDYPVWSIGLQLDYPLGNRSAENDYIKSRLKTEQTRVQISSLQESIAAETRTSLRSVQTAYKQLEVADRGRAYAEERLKAYLKKNEVGLATTKDVLDVENDLATARSNQIKAQVAYVTAISQLLKATGDLLEREGITVSAAPADALYRDIR
jgi:outer membrane protein TolC